MQSLVARKARLAAICHKALRALQSEWHRNGNTPKSYRLRSRQTRLWLAYKAI